MATIVEKQITNQSIPNKTHPEGMGTRTQNSKRGGSLNPTIHQSYMADSCLYTEEEETAKMYKR